MWATTPDEANNQVIIIAITTVLIFLCYLLFALRIISRKVLKTPLWIDDWFMLFCLFVCTMMSVLNYVGITFGSGVHRVHLPPDVYRNFQINLYIFMMSWALGVAVVKIGILLFYYRVFSVAEFRRSVKVLGVILLLTSTAIFIAFAFQCTPVPHFWADEPGTCIDQVAFYISGGSLNIVGDVLVLSLPIRRVWALKATLSQRMALVLLFALGGFVCITSIFRLTALNEIDPTDFSYTNVAGGLWSTVEVQVGFICANLPHTRPLFVRWFMPWRAEKSYGSFNGSASGNTHIRPAGNAGFKELSAHARDPAAPSEYNKHSNTDTESGLATDDNDQELATMTPWERAAPRGNGGISVRTDVRLEVRDEQPAPKAHPSQSDWEDPVLTRISAKKARTP